MSRANRFGSSEVGVSFGAEEVQAFGLKRTAELLFSESSACIGTA